MIIHFKSFLWALLLGCLVLLVACSQEGSSPNLIFERLPGEQTRIDFQNTLSFDPDFNIYNYRNFYNGGGVAVGDINGDGLPDIYFVSNMGENRLYLNRGEYQFEDITESSGVAGRMPWATGASMADINGNGLLDIYVTNSGEFEDDRRRNELFINNGDLTFTENATAFGIDDSGYGIHANFFDYDGDGDMDLYLLNNSNAAIGSFDISNNQREERNEAGGDKLYRNDGDTFTDVSEMAGIYGSEIGFSLSASIGDINRDGLPDIYVANDFFERDYLYLNNGDGTFTEDLNNQVRSTTGASMGSDLADLTNNGWPDVVVLDMLPEENQRLKTVTTFEPWSFYREKVGYGYGHQFTRNVLQINNGDSTFSEIGRLAGIEATDWSWAVLAADFDHNGFNDLFITNGLVQDITNLDYLGEIQQPDMIRSIVTGENVDYEELVDLIPSEPIGNVMYSNNGGLKFSDQSEAWGIDEPGFSSGAAWADLNGNGALDLIINEVNGPASIYRNKSAEIHPDRTGLFVELEGKKPNTQAVGAQLDVWAGGKHWYREHMLQRGYQSSVAPGLHIGLGNTTHIDSLQLRWPDGQIQKLGRTEVPAPIKLVQKDAERDHTVQKGNKEPLNLNPSAAPLLKDITMQTRLKWSHRENNYSDFDREQLLVHMRSTEGPALCISDVNGDGSDDVYTGGARGQPGSLFLQMDDGMFEAHQVDEFSSDASSEDTDCLFFDADGDGHPDLYVTSGGNSFSTGSSAMRDRLYFGDGQGGFSLSDLVLPSRTSYVSSSTVSAGDFTGDGHPDLFVGERLKLFSVGMPGSGYLLKNDGKGGFEEVTVNWTDEFTDLGMVTDAQWIDWDNDGRQDLVVVGEWMPPRIFRNNGERLVEITGELGLSEMTGWWNTIHATDLNGNGRMDLVLGNHGLNSQFRASDDVPVKMWVDDFSGNGFLEQILSMPRDGKQYPVALRHELLEEIPSLEEKYPDYASFGGETVHDIFPPEQLAGSRELEARELASVVIWNEGDLIARKERLPLQAQISPIYAIWSGDLTGDGQFELILGGNLHEVKPIAGPYDASYGTVIGINEDGDLYSLPQKRTGLKIRGAIRAINSVESTRGKKWLIVARNNDSPVVLEVGDRTESRE